MNIPEEIIENIASDLMKELESSNKTSEKQITFDDIENKILEARQRIGEIMMQKSVEIQSSKKTDKKKVSGLRRQPKR